LVNFIRRSIIADTYSLTVMELSVGYVPWILAVTVSLALLLIKILAKINERAHHSNLEILLATGGATKDELCHEYLAPLLLYEEEYPSFTNILSMVLSKFPLERFTGEDDFQEALVYLRDSVFKSPNREQIVSAMCQVVSGLVRDPDVEYTYRERIHTLVENFLEEIK